MSHRHEAGRNPRVVLVFPPFFWTNQVYMSLPVLAGVLQQQGIPFELRDLNLEFRERLVNPAFLGKMLSEGALLRIAEDSSAPKTRRQAAAASHLALPYVIRHIDEAMDVVKIGRSCLSIEEMEKLEAGVMLMDYAFRIASIPFWPLRLDVACGHGEVLIDLKQIAANIDEDTAPKVYGEFFNGVVSGLASWEDVALFGISVASHRQLHAAYILASVVKDRYPHMPVALGGALTPYMEHMIQGCPDEAFRWIDYYVVGEGDTALCRLYDHVVRQEPVNRVPNLFHILINQKFFSIHRFKD